MNKLTLLISKNLLFYRGIGLMLILMLSGMTAFSQGTVKGVVTDGSDDSPLISVNVVIKGTTVGTITNYNGEYILPLKAGTYVLQISYMGYESQEKEITIEDGQTIEYSASLLPSSIMGGEVVITMQARGQIAAVNQQINSNKIVNVVSAERIRELPDENAAQAISRLPGVHLDGSKVVIRGVEPKMNKITVNGVELPSTDSEDRSTDLGMISSNMLSGIEVVKTLTPDMDADAVGGVVNLRLREAQKGLHFNLMGQGGYNAQEKYMGKYVFWGDVSNRFLDDKLGVILSLNYEKRQYGQDRYEKNYSNVSPYPDDLDRGDYIHSGTNTYDDYNTRDNIGGSLIIDYDFGNGQIIYSGMFTNSAIEETYHEIEMSWGGQNTDYLYTKVNGAKYNQLLMNHALRVEQQFGIVGLDAGVAYVTVDSKDDFRYEWRIGQRGEPNFYPQLITESNVRESGEWDFYDWLNPTVIPTWQSIDYQYRPEDFNENQVVADINFTAPLRITEDINIDFKVGGKYKRKDRNYDEVQLQYYNNNILQVNSQVGQDWFVENLGHEHTLGANLYYTDFADYDYSPNGDYMNGEGAQMPYVLDVDLLENFTSQIDYNRQTTLLQPSADDERNDYWGFETYSAGYFMAEINLGKRILIIPGIRYERVHNEYTAPKIEYRGMTNIIALDTLTKPATHENLLPHFHLRFKATDWWDIRFSYNNTLTRPDYTHALPNVYYNTSDFTGTAGNPYIKPAKSENFDANFSFHSRKLGLITIGGFYKKLTDVFYMQETVLENIPDTSIVAEFDLETYQSLKGGITNFYINNPFEAYIKGLEFEWQSNLTWLPSPFNGIVINANYTRVWSETEYIQHRMLYITPPGGYIPVPTESDTSYKNQLINQADDIGNISLGYDYKGFSARLSFRYQGNVVSDIAGRESENEYTDEEYKWDFNMKQTIPSKLGDFEVFFSAINFTNVPYRRYINYPYAGTSRLERTTYKRWTGRQFQFGLRFKY